MMWSKVQIKKTGLRTRMRDPQKSPHKPFNYVDISSIDRGLKVITSAPALLGADAPSRARKEILEGDVLVSTVRPNLNAVAVVPPHLNGQITSTGFCVLRPNPAAIDGKYLFYFTTTPYFVDTLSSKVRGAHYPAVSDGDVKEIDIPLPPLSEQRRIVEILDHADALRKKRAVADEKTARILPALFYKMFGDPATNPKGWPTKQIREVCRVVSGATPRTNRSEYWGGGIPWATPKDLSGLDDWVLERTGRTLTGEGLASCSTTMMPVGAVLLSSRAPIGYVAIAGIPMCTNQGFKSLVCEADIDPWYLFAWCKLRTAYLQSLGRGATFTEVSTPIVESIRLPLPPLTMQQKFRARIHHLRKIHEQRHRALHQFETTFQSLLHRAFTGDLTATWREMHLKELLQEMKEQAKYLDQIH